MTLVVTSSCPEPCAYLRIPARCKECPHTGRSHSIRAARGDRGHRRTLDVQEDLEVRRSLEDLWNLSCFLPVDLNNKQEPFWFQT